MATHRPKRKQTIGIFLKPERKKRTKIFFLCKKLAFSAKKNNEFIAQNRLANKNLVSWHINILFIYFLKENYK
jgi:hypothetical protein